MAKGTDTDALAGQLAIGMLEDLVRSGWTVTILYDPRDAPGIVRLTCRMETYRDCLESAVARAWAKEPGDVLEKRGVGVFKIWNDRGREFNVRLVKRGERWGLNDGLTHDKDDPLVEFYGERGQFVSNYYLSTLEESVREARGGLPRGLLLWGDDPAWSLDGAALLMAVRGASALAAQPEGMKVKLKIEGDVLALIATGVEDTPEARGHMSRIELELMRYYSHHVSEPVIKGEDGKLTFHFHRGDSDHKLYEGARRILRGFQIEV